MNRVIPYKWKWRVLLALVFALAATLVLVTISLGQDAPEEDPPCGTGGSTCPLVGDFDPISVGPAEAGAWQVSGPSAPAFGALVYDPDYKLMEAQARAKLTCGLDVREAISPYKGNIAFEDYVKTFDYEAGWSQEAPDLAGTGCFPTGTNTLEEVVDAAAASLLEARNLYAHLAVYAPEHRFRADPDYITITPPNYTEPLCGATSKEDPDPADPAHSGLVLDPVIDWCDFSARLRQSVREAAYLRMIFGQQFMVDALGLQFSGTTLLGAEAAVRQEAARLRAAKYQYERAEAALNEALDHNLGSGCYVSDFFQQAEWSLFSRAIEGQETAQHHLAVRLSYLDVPQEPGGPQQTREAGVNALRKASINGYIKMIGMAGLGAGQPTGAGCAKGTRPDGALVAEMALNLAETRRKANEMASGRNVFGFDVTFTPARAYTGGDCGTATAGLWQDAWCAAQLAQDFQDAEVAANREYNQAQDDLRTEVQNIQNGIDSLITAQSGCSPADWTCVDEQIAALNTCLELVWNTQNITDTNQVGPFDTCINGAGINNSAAKRALWDLRSVYVQQFGIEKKAEYINNRIDNSDDANLTVITWLGISGVAETAARVSQAALDAVECSNETGTIWGGWVTCASAGGWNAGLQLAAGAASTAANCMVENAENHKETQNLLLDQSELLIDAYAARQQFLSKYAEYTSLLDSLRENVTEAQRQRAYFAHSPANDPSFRILRDSTRLQFAKQLALASKLTYLAARRAEYEYAARLNASDIRYSDIYRARTAADLKAFLNNLSSVTRNLPAGTLSNLNAEDLTFSVAQHWLNLTDAVLISEGYTTPEAIQAERTLRFRQWVAEHTVPNDFESPYDGKPVLKFDFTTSLVEGGTFPRLIPQGYDGYWLITLSGIGAPIPSSHGFSINLVSDQAGMAYRKTRVTQGGLVHLRSQAGCVFDYRLIAPAALLGLEWPSNQNAEVATAGFRANVNEETPYTDNGMRTAGFQGRAASATDWLVKIFSGAPEVGLSDMDLQQLTDIELNFSIIHASREPGPPPELSECTRIDW